MATNIIKPTGDQSSQASHQELQNSQHQNMGSFNRLSQRTPYDGAVDKNGELRLRLAVIDNSELTRDVNSVSDPLDVTNIVNLGTGKVTLKWVDIPGGVIRSNETGGEWTNVKENEKYNPEERDFNNWDIQSRREMVSLTHPFIWSNNKNWAGFNYIPPVGATVIVGFRKQGLPLILGFVPTHFKICYPVLQPGELSMKGYGNNYAHWRWSEKLDMKAWSVKNEKDNDDPNKVKKNDTDCTLWLRLNANDRYIKIQATEIDKPPYKAHQSHNTILTVSPKNFQVMSAEIADEYSPNHSQQRYTSLIQSEELFEVQAFNPGKGYSTTYQQSAGEVVITAGDDNTASGTVYDQTLTEINISASQGGSTANIHLSPSSILSSVNGANTLLTGDSFTVNANNINMNSQSINISNGGTFSLTSSAANVSSSSLSLNGSGSTVISGGGSLSLDGGTVAVTGGTISLN